MTYVSGSINRTAHYNNLLDSQESLGIFGCCECKICQWADGYNGDRVWLVVSEQLEHLLMGWLQRRLKKRMLLFDSLQLGRTSGVRLSGVGLKSVFHVSAGLR